MKNKMKPCPFCGCAEIGFENDVFDGMGLLKMAYCIKCGVMLEKSKWNKRAMADSEVALRKNIKVFIESETEAQADGHKTICLEYVLIMLKDMLE